MTDWIKAQGSNVILTLHIQPGAKKTGVAGIHGDALKIRLAAPPVDGKANSALIAFVAETLGLAKSKVTLISGQTSRAKRIAVEGGSPEEIRAILLKAEA